MKFGTALLVSVTLLVQIVAGATSAAPVNISLIPFEPPSGGTTIAPHIREPLSAEASALVAGNNEFALDMYQRLSAKAEPDENVLFSPFSISAALAMTYAGASGQTAEQLADGMRFNLADDKLHSAFGELLRDLGTERDGYQLSIANRLFGQSGYPFEQPFLETTGRDYGAELEAADFARDPDGSRTRINGWVADQTHDKIQNLLPQGSVNRYTRLVLTNAIYFNGSWKHKFHENLTKEKIFSRADGGQSQVEMMWQQQSFKYTEQPGLQVLEMPYAGDDLSMVVFLPSQPDGLPELEASLDTEFLTATLDALHTAKVNVSLPKFTFSSSFQLVDSLTEMGVTDAFDPWRADFAGIVDPEFDKLYISTAVHKAFIDVNEEGTEAAAATGIGIGTTAYSPPEIPKEFRADHPFLFALRDRHSGSLLFLGRVTDPGELVAAAAAAHVPEPTTLTLALLCTCVFLMPRRAHTMST